MNTQGRKLWFNLCGLLLLFAATFIVPAFIFTNNDLLTGAGGNIFSGIIIPLWLIGAICGLAYMLLGFGKDTSRRLSMRAGALFLLLLKILNPIDRPLDGSLDLDSYTPGLPYFGDGCSFLMGLLAVVAISGIASLISKRDFALKPFFLHAAACLPIVLIASILDGLSFYLSWAFKRDGCIILIQSTLMMRLSGFFIQLLIGVGAGFLILKRQSMPVYTRVSVIVLGFLALARIVLALWPRLASTVLALWPEQLRGVFGYAITANFYQFLAIGGVLIAASILCIGRAKASKQTPEPV